MLQARMAEWEDEILLRGRKEGWKKGWKEGWQEGMKEGKISLLERQLTHKFDSIPDWAQNKLHAASTEELERWALEIFDAESLEDFLNKYS